MIKTCKHCGEMLKKKLNETEGNFRKRVYCGRSCAKSFEYVGVRGEMVERCCEACGKAIPLDMAPSLYKARRFCDNTCRTKFHEYRLNEYHESRSNIVPGTPRLPSLKFLRRM